MIRIEVNDNAHKIYNMNSSTKSKTKMLQSYFCGYNDAEMFVKKIWSFSNTTNRLIKQTNNIKNWPPFLNCIGEINNTLIDNTLDLNVVCRWSIVKTILNNLKVYGNTTEIN